MSPHYAIIKISDTTSIVVYKRKKVMEIITNTDGKQTSITVGWSEIKKLKQLLSVVGLPPVCIQMQLAIKKLVSIRTKWANNDPQVIQAENEVYAAYRALAEFNTKRQAENIELISGIGGTGN